MRIGLAGCGTMGWPMAEALSSAGFQISGLDIRPSAEFNDFAAPFVSDSTVFAQNTEILFSVVRDIPQTEELLWGDQALIANADSLRCVVICSTVSPSYIHKLREKLPDHIALIDAPMSGAPIAARERNLSFMIGGDEANIDPLMPLFNAMGTTIHRLGPLGTGMMAKVLNNMVAASSVAATRLALDWAQAAGMQSDDMLDVLKTSSGQTWFGSNIARIDWAEEGFSQSNTMGILVKDVNSALSAAPTGARLDLPQAVIAAISQLKPVG